MGFSLVKIFTDSKLIAEVNNYNLYFVFLILMDSARLASTTGAADQVGPKEGSKKDGITGKE
jgi:hypothetical protein